MLKKQHVEQSKFNRKKTKNSSAQKLHTRDTMNGQEEEEEEKMIKFPVCIPRYSRLNVDIGEATSTEMRGPTAVHKMQCEMSLLTTSSR